MATTEREILSGQEFLEQRQAGSMSIEDGADLTFVQIFSLLRRQAGESVVRTAHIGLFNTLTTATIYGTGSTQEAMPLYPTVILHEFQPGMTEDDDYPNHYVITPWGSVTGLCPAANEGPALYFRWGEGKQEELVSLGFPSAEVYASPAQFFLHETRSPDGARFPTILEYLIYQDVIDIGRILEITQEVAPERFYKAIGTAGDYYDLTVVGETTLTYIQRETGETWTVARGELAKKVRQYMEMVAHIARNPTIHISDIQKEPGIIMDSIFFITTIGAIESVTHNSSVVYHASGTQMYRYLTENGESGKARRQAIRELYAAVYKETADEVDLKRKVSFVVFPTRGVVPFTVPLSEAEDFNRAVDRTIEIGRLKGEVEKNVQALRSFYQAQVVEAISGADLDTLEEVVSKKFPDFPADQLRDIIVGFDRKWKTAAALAVIGEMKKEAAERLQAEIYEEVQAAGSDEEMVEKVREGYGEHYHHTRLQRDLKVLDESVRRAVIQRIKRKNYEAVFGMYARRIAEVVTKMDGIDITGGELSIDQINVIQGHVCDKASEAVEDLTRDEIDSLSSSVKKLAARLTRENRRYNERNQILDTLHDQPDWESKIRRTLADINVDDEIETIRARQLDKLITRVSTKIALSIVKVEELYSSLEQDIVGVLEGVTRKEAVDCIGRRYGKQYAARIPQIIEEADKGILSALCGKIIHHLVEQDGYIRVLREYLKKKKRRSRDELELLQSVLHGCGRELNQFDQQLFVHPIALTTPIRKLPDVKSYLLSISAKALEETEKQ